MTLGPSWIPKLTGAISGLLSLLLGVPIFVTAVQAWANHQAVDWRNVLVSTAFIVISAGLAAAKQQNVHGGTKEAGTRPAGEVPAPLAALTPAQQLAAAGDDPVKLKEIIAGINK